MGESKAFLQFGQGTFLSRVLSVVRAVVDDVYIVGSSTEFAEFAPVVEDVYPDAGPLGGIHAALGFTSTDFNLIVAVDLPFLLPGFLRMLVEKARSSAATITVPRLHTGSQATLQPLCAVYRRDFREVAQQALEAGNNRIDRLFEGQCTCIFDIAEDQESDLDSRMFTNINTPTDLAHARQILAHQALAPDSSSSLGWLADSSGD